MDVYEQRRCRFLVVEEHPLAARSIRKLLNQLGHDVVVADDMFSAVDAAKSEAFDVLLCCATFVDGSARQLLSKLRSSRPLKAVAVTGHARDDEHERLKRAGFDAIVVKPFAFESLVTVIAHVTAQVCDVEPRRASCESFAN